MAVSEDLAAALALDRRITQRAADSCLELPLGCEVRHSALPDVHHLNVLLLENIHKTASDLFSGFVQGQNQGQGAGRATFQVEALSKALTKEQLMARLSETEACGFEELFADIQSRAGMVVTFLALLEMIRTHVVRVFQQANFGLIRVYKRAAVINS